MPPAKPLFAVHRRNRIAQLAEVPRGRWIEIDVDIHEGAAWLTHDPLTSPPAKMSPQPDRLEDFIPAALAQGIAGFIVDCKRENVEKYVQPLLDRHGVGDYFYLNEMEVQADIFQSQSPSHQSAMRIWRYRGAEDVIRLAEDMRAAGQTAPQWAWVDCWQRGLLQDIERAHVPLTGKQAARLQAAGVKLCICSPELYVHKYDIDYDAAALAVFHRGIAHYRQKLAEAGVQADAVCSKFAAYWNA